MILASSSKIRARILEAAGLAFIVEPPGLDEGVMRQAVSGERALGAHDVAEVLARAKAEAVSDLAPKAYVIGADQVLAFGNQIMSKPDSMETARRELLDLSGKSHTLHTSGRRPRSRPSLCASSRPSSSAAILPLPARRC